MATGDLVAVVGLTEASSFEAVYDAHFDYVYRVVARLAGSSDAEDLTQEVFVIVHRKLDGFQARAELTTWLFRIAYRVAAAHFRKQRFRRAVLRAFGRELCVAPSVADGDDSVARALGRLPLKKRAVLVLHEVEGWPCAVIAERLGIPIGTVHTRLHHARHELARMLGRGGRP